MDMNKLLEGVEASQVVGGENVSVLGLACDSRRVESGWLFAALQGETHNGNDYIPQAVAGGACAVLSEQAPPPGFETAWVQVSSARRALSQVAANFYGHPARSMRVVGITGTNGKTTTSYLLQAILSAAGGKTALFGTVRHRTAGGEIEAINTTPESLDLQRYLAEWRDSGAGWAVMEVSSHGLAFNRVYGIPYSAAVFTNLAGDHLDYHKTMESYFEAKQQLFLGLGTEPPGVSVINMDDAYGKRLRELCQGRVALYGLESNLESEEVQYTALNPKLSFAGTVFDLKTPEGNVPIHSSLVGRSNLYNLVAACATAHVLGFGLDTIAKGIESLKSVPGRFERVAAGQPFTVIIDFAHTDLAFTNLFHTARELTRNRVIIVFGSGGDRDRTKRPVMGEIAGRLADFVVLTTDNPRSEDPAQIMEDTLAGVRKAGGKHEIVEDREQAFARAFELAQEGDIVLLAGKGHQETQIFSDREEPWSESEAALRALARLGFASEEARPE